MITRIASSVLVVTLALLGSLAASEHPAASPMPRALFIGNSYTIANDLHRWVAHFAATIDQPLHAERRAVGGQSLTGHIRDGALPAIMEGAWDLVVLQEQSRGPIRDPDGFLAAAGALADHARRHGAQPVGYVTWSSGNAPETLDAIVAAYRRLAAAHDVLLAPCGPAWALATERHPDIRLYQADGSHPELAGTYLNACVFHAVLTGRSPEGLPHVLDDRVLDPDVARALQIVARDTVAAFDQPAAVTWAPRPRLRQVAPTAGDRIADAATVDLAIEVLGGAPEHVTWLARPLPRRDDPAPWQPIATGAPTTSATWQPASSGRYQVIARAQDGRGVVTDSAPHVITVGDLPNLSPQVVVPSAERDPETIVGSSVTIGYRAWDEDGPVRDVALLHAGRVVAQQRGHPGFIAWEAPPVGQHQVRLRVSDHEGAEGWSTPFLVHVVPDDGQTTFPVHGMPIRLPGRVPCEDWDVGGAGRAYHDGASNQRPAWRGHSAVETAHDPTTGAVDVVWMTPGEWLVYTVEVSTAGRYRLLLRGATPREPVAVTLSIGDQSCSPTLPVTGDWLDRAHLILGELELAAGVQTLRFTVREGRHLILDAIDVMPVPEAAVQDDR